MSLAYKPFRIDVSEPDLIAEASRESSFQAESWTNIKFWTPDIIERNVIELKDSADESDDVQNQQPTSWLTRHNTFNEHERKVIQFPPVTDLWPRGYTSVNTLEEWDCVITDVTDETVFSDAKPQIEQRGSKVILEIPVNEFSRGDRSALRPGLMFRYIICWSKRESGNLSRESFTYIRKVQRRIVSSEEKYKLDLALSVLESHLENKAES